MSEIQNIINTNTTNGKEEIFVVKKTKKIKTKSKNIQFIIEDEEKKSLFINQVFRKDILANMIANTNLTGKELFNIIMSDNNSSPSDSRRGDLYETLCEILLINKCIDKLNYTNIMSGDLSSLKNVKNIKTFLCKKIHQGGNVSDISITNDTVTICFSIKYKKKISKKGTDINDLDSTLKKYYDNYKIGLFVKSKEDISGSKKNDIHKEIFDKIIENDLLFDEKDIIKALDVFCQRFSSHNNKYSICNVSDIDEFIEFINSEYLLSPRQQLTKKLHQQMTELKFIRSFSTNKHKMWCIAHKPRSGKSILLISICKYLLENGYKKILIMTSVPATIDSFIKDLELWIDFKDINYKIQEEIDTIEEKFNGIVFCSVQFLKTDGKSKKTELLKKLSFDAIITDEAHQGSSTDKTKTEILDIDNDVEEIRKNIKLNIFASGTPDKTKKYYGIHSSCVYEWEIEDESFMKELNKPLVKNKKDIIEYMVSRHGTVFIECLENETLNKDYSKHPTQVLMKHFIPDSLINEINEYNAKYGSNFGYNCSSLFALKQIINEKGELEYAEEFDLCKTTDGIDILKEFFDSFISKNRMRKTIMKQIENTQTSRGSRKSTIEKPLLFIMYLPTHTRNNTISSLQKTIKQFLETHNLWCDYNIEYSNSMEDTGNIKENYNEYIQTIMNKTKTENKKGCILLLGNKGSVGITYKDCDVTISLDDGHNLDNQKQRFSRALTEADGKTIGINVDMNIQRSYLYLIDMIQKHRRNTKTIKTNAEILYYLFEHNIFLFDPQQFNNGKMTTIEIMTYYQKESENIMNNSILPLVYSLLDNVVCDDDMRNFIKTDFQKRILNKIDKNLEGEQQDCPKGEKTKVQIDNPNSNINDDKELDNELNQEDTAKIELLINQTYEMCKSFLFPLLALISRSYKINDFKAIFTSDKTKELIISLLKDKKIELNNDNNYIIIVNIMNNIIDNNSEIINNIREIYSIASYDNLQKLIAKHFIPTEEEKKGNAEVPTPVNLVKEMIHKMPVDFWKKPRKVFEPCCGKGNFLLEIVRKFDEGLKELYPDNEERIRIIMTECIYYADLTALNVFISTELLRCEYESICGINEINFQFNNHTGDTLQLNIGEKWLIEGFDAIIGNPPYQECNIDGRKALNHNLWSDFINYSYHLLLQNGFLLHITPNSWMSPTGKNNHVFYNNHIIYLNINECEKHFNVGSKFSYYLIQKTNEKKETEICCLYNKKIYHSKILIDNYEFLPNLICDKSLSILKKFYTNDLEKISFKTMSELHRTTKKNNIKDIRDEEFKYPIRHTSKNDVIYSNIKHSLSDKNKILMNLSGNLKPIYDNGKMGFTQAQMYLLTDEEEYVNVINSKLFSFVFDICKWSGFNIEKIFHNIPFIKTKKTNEEIYEMFGLNQEEINLIEETLKKNKK
jgi:hypothetical protein